ncbi:MAG: low affinity iron permease family protein [Acidimicrobiia bacterium]|jgi:low affinity Fe/Cu permease|nr:low affinity iron permease family protein [Acidimicrobiia bacterium]
MAEGQPTAPTEVTGSRGRFDKVADQVSTLAARSGFFIGLVVVVVAWAALGVLFGFSHGWIDDLEIAGTIVTLLLVALLENEQWRNSKATQRKLNAVADALAHLLASDASATDHVRELQAAVGLEKRESTTE